MCFMSRVKAEGLIHTTDQEFSHWDKRSPDGFSPEGDGWSAWSAFWSLECMKKSLLQPWKVWGHLTTQPLLIKSSKRSQKAQLWKSSNRKSWNTPWFLNLLLQVWELKRHWWGRVRCSVKSLWSNKLPHIKALGNVLVRALSQGQMADELRQFSPEWKGAVCSHRHCFGASIISLVSIAPTPECCRTQKQKHLQLCPCTSFHLQDCV